jgi:hypothetical protein
MLLSREAITTPLFACLCIFGISWMQLPRLQKLLTHNQSVAIEALRKAETKENLRLNLLQKIPSFSYNNLIANWVYIDFLQYFGDEEIRNRIGYNLSPEYFEVILKQDPRFLDAYLSLSVSTSLYAGMPERSVKLMDQGLQSLSPQVPHQSYYVWRYKGTDELLFLGNAEAAKSSLIKAAEWAKVYPDPQSQYVALVSQKTAEFLQNNPDSKFARISSWVMVLENNVDTKTRKRAIKEIESLGGQIVFDSQGKPTLKFPDQD